MLKLTPAKASDTDDIVDFLRDSDLTVSGFAAASAHLWVAREEPTGRILATTGYEISENGRHALIRSVAVDPTLRGSGQGLDIAQFALDQAFEAGATRVWLFSRRSGPFWQKLGFTPAHTRELASALAGTAQVQLFVGTGQIAREIAWSRNRTLDER